MNTPFYRPLEGDSAGVVADGYQGNFEHLDESKADAQAAVEALATKVDKIEGHSLMSSEEHDKLSGIAAGANAYIHPGSHPADMISDTSEKVVMTVAERAKLADVQEGANAYSLPSASATTLGGVKVGRNLTIDSEGRLNAPAGGGSGDGGGILVLPYVEPERDGDGNISNSAAFVAAWGGILSQYLASPDSLVLNMEMDAGEGMLLRVPCSSVNIGDSEEQQWLLSGFSVVNMPVTETESASCKATCMAMVVCNSIGEMQSIVAYTQSGIVTSDGQPNLLGGDDAVIIELPFGVIDESVLKAAIQPLLPQLMLPTPPRVIVRCDVFWINGMFQAVGSQFIITAFGAHPYTVGDPDSTYIVRAGVIGTVVNGTITTVQGFTTGQELATKDYVTPSADAGNILVRRADGLYVPSGGYALPVATASALGGVKAGGNVTIAANGTLSYEMSKASPAALGGIKVGNNLSIREDGTLDAAAGGGTLPDGAVTESKIAPKAITTEKLADNLKFPPLTKAVTQIALARTENLATTAFVHIVREYYATKYNSPSESIVSGEFWWDFDGNKRQVYTRTFTGPAADLANNPILVPECTLVEALLVKGGLGVIAPAGNCAYIPPSTDFAGKIWDYIVLAGALLVRVDKDLATLEGLKYNMTFKYTKF